MTGSPSPVPLYQIRTPLILASGFVFLRCWHRVAGLRLQCKYVRSQVPVRAELSSQAVLGSKKTEEAEVDEEEEARERSESEETGSGEFV
jgi:hypothetical protein